jgi:hypothetical protein
MPGAPNRPPDTTPAAPAAPPVPETPEQRVLRRLAPSRIALLLDLWKGAPNSDLTAPFDKAEAAFAAGDFPNAISALDALSVRFAEPRWPTIPEPFRFLRVPIPAPMPPSWDPDHALPPPEKDARRARRSADEQLALAEASVAWMGAHAIDTADLTPRLAEAKTILGTEGVVLAFYDRIDPVWTAVRSRVPLPKSSAPRAAPAAPAPAPAAPASET